MLGSLPRRYVAARGANREEGPYLRQTGRVTTKISVAGLGYVGLSMAVLLARHNTVVGLDLDAPRIDKLRGG